MQTFTLTPHPVSKSSAVRRMGGYLSRTPGGLSVSYWLEGDLEGLRVPAPETPRFTDKLWHHTCFELFIARKGEPPYHEFNFSPSGEWAAYAFQRYRERMPLQRQTALATLSPHIAVHSSAGRLQLNAVVNLASLPAFDTGATLVLALSAVIESSAGALSYWALSHPCERPDFHHPDAFVLECDETRH